MLRFILIASYAKDRMVQSLDACHMNKMVTDNDDRLMVRIQRDLDEKALESLICLYTPKALAVAGQMLSDRVLAEDAVQESFLRVIRKRHQYKPCHAFSVWFFTILRNVCTDILRKRNRETSAIQLLALEPQHEPAINDHETFSTLCTGLSPAEKSVLTLRIVHDMRFQEISVALGITEEAAKKRAQRALQRLRSTAPARFVPQKQVV